MYLWTALSVALQAALVESCRRRWVRVRATADAGDAAVRALGPGGVDEAPPEVVELIREVRSASSRAAVRAAMNVHLVDVAAALDGASLPMTASARAGLFAGTGLALLSLSFHVRDGSSDYLAYVFDGGPFVGGLAGFAAMQWLGRRAEVAARVGKERWNRFARLAASQGDQSEGGRS